MKYVYLFLICFISFSCTGDSSKALELYIKGKEYYLQKDLQKAEENFKKALEADSGFHNAELMLAKIYYYQKKFDAALTHLERIIKADQDHVAALYWKARTLVIKSKNPENHDSEAMEILKKVTEIDGSHMPARALLALLYEKNKNYKEAIYEYKMILQFEETIVNARANLSILYKRMGLHEKSLEELKRAVEIATISGIPESNLKLLQSEIEK